jgi:ribosomal protein S27AE
MSRRYDDKDGIDAPFNQAWDAAIREDKVREDAKRKRALKCKRCGDASFMLTDKQRVELHAKLLALLSGPIDWTCPAEKSLLNPSSPPHVLGVAHNLSARLVAGDQGLCVYCTDYVEGPAT